MRELPIELWQRVFYHVANHRDYDFIGDLKALAFVCVRFRKLITPSLKRAMLAQPPLDMLCGLAYKKGATDKDIVLRLHYSVEDWLRLTCGPEPAKWAERV
jgi:hypothetical protein